MSEVRGAGRHPGSNAMTLGMAVQSRGSLNQDVPDIGRMYRMDPATGGILVVRRSVVGLEE